jgi:type I restriction enzyme R subunit
VLDLGIPGAAGGQPAVPQAAGGRRAGAVPADGETRGDFVRWSTGPNPARNEWLAVNQFSIKGPHHTRRPDIILFVNGLPLVLIELKNPADQNADIWKAFDQIQTYKEQIADVFQYNEVLVISDGTRRCWARSRPTASASCSGARSTA